MVNSPICTKFSFLDKINRIWNHICRLIALTWIMQQAADGGGDEMRDTNRGCKCTIMFCGVYDKCVFEWQPCCKASRPLLNAASYNWRCSGVLSEREASSFLLPLCTEDVFNNGCYLWTQNLDIYLLRLHSSPLSSHLISSLIFPPLSAATLYWHVFVLHFFPFLWHFFFFFLLRRLCSFSPWKHQKKKGDLLSFRVHMPSILCQPQKSGGWGCIDLCRIWDVIECNFFFWYVVFLFEKPT